MAGFAGLDAFTLVLLWLVFLSAALAVTVTLAPAEEEIVLRKRVRELATASAPADEYERRRLQAPFRERVLRPVAARLQQAIWARTPAGTRERIASRLVQAGQPYTAAAFVAQRVYGGLLGLAVGYAFARVALDAGRPAALALAGWALSAYAGTVVPEILLGRRIAARQRAFRRAFPEALDLLCVSVEAGLGLDGAIGKVAEKFTGPVQAEFSVYLRSVRLGTPREEALRALAERVGIPEVRAFASAVVQADRMGGSIAQVLRLESEEMRTHRRQAAQEQSMRAPVMLLFPLVLFIFPSIFIVLLGPALIAVLGALR